MPKCAVQMCKNHTIKVQKKDGVSYFHFPQNDIQRERWRRIIAQNREDEYYKPNSSSVVCSEHFSQSDMYMTKKGVKKILKTAIPNIQNREIIYMTEEESSESQITSPIIKKVESPRTSWNSTSDSNVEYAKVMTISNMIQPDELKMDDSQIFHLVTGTSEGPSTSSIASNLNRECINTKPIPKIIQSEESKTVNRNILPSESGRSEPDIISSNITIKLVDCIRTSIPDTIQMEKKDGFQIESLSTVKYPTTSLSLRSILDTPHKSCKKRLFDKIKKVKNLQKSVSRLKKRNASLKSTIAVLRKHKDLDESVLCNLSSHVEVKYTFNALFLKNNNNKKRPFPKYPPGARKFALTLHFYSPAAYRYIRKIFHNCLPHPNTLFQWYRSVEAKPGFTAEALDRLKQKSEFSEKEILCALIADEMAIRQQKIWCGGHYIGVVDMGLGEATDNNPIAQQAYVLLLVCLNEKWKIPLAYFFITGLKAEMKANIINIALQKCHAVGVKIVSLTFDGCKSNLLTMKLLGCNINNVDNLKTYFKHPISNEDVTVFLDACHMVKLMRNTLESKKKITDNENKVIRWKLLYDLNDLQQKIQLNLANKLTNRHIELKNEIMKVKLATQLMSRSVAKAIQFCQELKLPAFENSAATIKFLLLINDLFDILNSRNLKDAGYKKPLKPENANQCFLFLQNAKEYLKSLTINIKRKKTVKKKNDTRVIFTTETVPLWKSQANTGVIGLLVCIESVQNLYRNVVEAMYLSFLITYKVSQDHIELFFENIRSHGEHNNNPNAQQFMTAYKKNLTFIETNDKFSGNCIPLEDMPILNCGNAVSNINTSSIGFRFELELEDEQSRNRIDTNEAEVQKYQGNCDIFSATLDKQSTGHESELIVQIIGYVAGFVVRHLLKHLKCESCKNVLLAKTKLEFHKLIDIKDFGGLCYASNDVFLICKKTELILRRFLRTGGCVKEKMCITVMKQFTQSDLFIEIDEHWQVDVESHKVKLLKAIIEKYIDIRLHYAGKFKTAEIKIKSKRQLFNKLNLFQGT